jgi:hypothetical protein
MGAAPGLIYQPSRAKFANVRAWQVREIFHKRSPAEMPVKIIG